jgi:hypothetical protein
VRDKVLTSSLDNEEGEVTQLIVMSRPLSIHQPQSAFSGAPADVPPRAPQGPLQSVLRAQKVAVQIKLSIVQQHSVIQCIELVSWLVFSAMNRSVSGEVIIFVWG